MTNADIIALINVDPVPPTVTVDPAVGAVAVNYATVQYNGATITAAQVTPPGFLNIVSKVVNKVAYERNAIAATVPAAAGATPAAVVAALAAIVIPRTSLAEAAAEQWDQQRQQQRRQRRSCQGCRIIICKFF
ncbi:MAG: hypothetical protein LBQ23_03925 [Puniceicoccales bacterium]|jgi:RNase P protein component|nr:hypothetical protein [Puniceicoccales bacterium]